MTDAAEGPGARRGRPRDPGQFAKECFGAGLLHQHTRVPVAHPYLLDSSTVTFPVIACCRTMAADRRAE